MIRINDTKSKTTLKGAFLACVFLLFAVATGFGQTNTVNLTAGPNTTTMPDGTTLPMWGYTCGTVSGSATCAPLTGSTSAAATGALGGIYVINGGSGYANGASVSITGGGSPTTPATATVVTDATGKIIGVNVVNHGAGYTAAPTVSVGGGTGAVLAAAPAWSPIVITVPFASGGGNLTINLTNNLSFAATNTPNGATNTSTTNAIPTSMVIIGQMGGGLGVASTSAASPNHAYTQGCPSWFIAQQPPGTPCTAASIAAAGAAGPLATPPNQGNRVQSMAQEVVAGTPGSLTWGALRPGTYLLESGTHPSIQVPMGLIGMLVVTTPPSGATAGTAYPAGAATNIATKIPAITYNAEVPLEFSEIDPVQNKAVDAAVRTSGFSEIMPWSGLPTGPDGNPGCGYPGSTSYQQCYPPAVNYTPFYFLINGLAFDKANPAPSLFAATDGAATTGIPVPGTLLVRMVNAGLKMHVPSIVGSLTTGFNGTGTPATVSGGTTTTGGATVGGFTLIAEDGNPVPDYDPNGNLAPRVKTEVFMAAGKTEDVMVNVPSNGASLPVFDRELSLSANSSVRDAGMLAYIGVNGSMLPVTAGTGAFSAATANPDSYAAVVPCATGSATCVPLVVSDPSKGVIANDVNVYGVALSTAPANGTLSCAAIAASPVAGICANGTFTYTPNAGNTSGSDTFEYCANGTVFGQTNAVCAQVTLTASQLAAGGPTAINQAYTSKMATYIKIPSPGILAGNTDTNGLPISVVLSSITLPACTNPVTALCGTVDANGGFTLAIPTPASVPTTPTLETFNYTVQNSQGVQSTASGTVTVTFPVPSNLKVHVLDAQAYNNCNGSPTCIAGLSAFPDYKWIIEEDKTFWVDPNCTTNNSGLTAGNGCPTVVGGSSTSSPSGSTIPTFGVNFHTSNMDYVAQGCTGPLSCEAGQTVLDTRPACSSPGVPAGCSATSGQHVPAVCDVGNGACRPDPACTTLPCYSAGGYTPVNPSQVVLDPSKRYFISVLPGDAANPFPANVSAPSCPALGAEAPGGDTSCGHTMSGAPIPPACNILTTGACTSTSAFTNPVNVLVLPTPLPTGSLSVIVFEDDYPLNGEQDGGGGNATVAPIEPGLGGFNLVLWDTYGGLGDVTGQDTYDEFNQPLSNSLAGTVDPVTGFDACPITENTTVPAGAGTPGPNTPQTGGVTGMIVTCPKYESDGATLSPLAGQAVITHLMPEKFSVQAYPGADRIARGEQWIQTNTLDGQHPHDSFIRIGEPTYFQEYGPAGYHVQIGFANPSIINARHDDVCHGLGSPGSVGPCTNTITGLVNVERLSRTPDQRLYPSGSRDALAWTQCWVSLGDPDGEDFMFTFCDANGNFTFNNVPGGEWRLTIGDQWNDQIIDGLSTPANVGCTSQAPNIQFNSTTCPGGQTLNLGNVAVQQWQANLYTRTFIDNNKDGVYEPDQGDLGIPFIYTMIHYRDGHNANALTTDFNGVANFNETFPLFNWYVVEADTTRYKTTGIHTVYDAGGPADGSGSCGAGSRGCGTSTAYNFLTNTKEAVPLPADLSVPGAVYCTTADCGADAATFANGTPKASSASASTGRIDSPWVGLGMEGFSGLTGLSNWMDIGKAPYAATENGGIYGYVGYASTRPFDDASQMIQQPWEPNIPNVTVNLYQESYATDGYTKTLTLVDSTQSASWDDWAQGFYPNYTDPTTGTVLPYMNCPGQGTNASGATNQDLFYFTLYNQPNYLDWYNSLQNGGTLHALPYNSQYKCYDAMHVGNQLQPAPYDGKYKFPSVLSISPLTGKPDTTLTGGVGIPIWSNSTRYAIGATVVYQGMQYTAVAANVGVVPSAASGAIWGTGAAPAASFKAATMGGTNCTVCIPNPDATDKWRVGTPMLPPGKYVVEVIMPAGYEVYKEEDKNLLIGDNFIAPVTQQFGGLGTDIFILPDQASVATMYDANASGFNSTNYQDSTTSLSLQAGTLSGVPGFPGFDDQLWPCVGEMRVVPDYLSIYPGAKETAPFAGATRPLCDRKEITLTSQMGASAKFFLFTSTHIASKYTGVITDDYTSEFDPFAPQFGEKFAPPNLPVSTKDYLGNELSRVYSDHWGTYDGLTFSSWEVNPPNITGYSPTMLVQCMNDPGPIMGSNGQLVQDPLYNPAYSDFCYENPFMPGLTTYNDTPVVPTTAFVGAAYNFPDCSYPDATPAILEVDSQDGIGPWVSATGHTLTITAIGNTQVTNTSYAGPSANAAPFNLKTIQRHYGFLAQCSTPSASSTTCNTKSAVTIGGVAATVTGWSDSQITVTVPTGVANCAVQQQKQYGGPGTTTASFAKCGELVITAGNGQQSVDTVTVTIGGKAPTHITASQSIQSAIDAAKPGDLLMVDPTCTAAGVAATCSETALRGATQTAAQASHNEMLLMWKPVRLQGVGAVTSIIDASAFPGGKLLDPWRRHVNCLFGLTLNGVPQGSSTTLNPTPAVYDPNGVYNCPETGWNYFGTDLTGTGKGTAQPLIPQVDRLPLEAVVGWDATVNGNLAEQLQEPSLMGAYEGAGVTVLAKGVWTSAGESPWTDGSEPGAFPPDALLLQDVPVNSDDEGAALGPQTSFCWTINTRTGASNIGTELSPNPYPSNYECNPSSIDGVTIRDSSQGGGGIFVHGWAHNLQVSNNRVYNNAGTLSGGITVGQGEFPIALTIVDQEGAAPPNGAIGEFVPDNPPSCVYNPFKLANPAVGTHLPYCLDNNVNVHNNYIAANSSLGDELFSGTLAGGGGATFCTGSDNYQFKYNWVCGNVSSAEGGGVAHIGFIYNGDIEHNTIALNQSTNPTIPTNGGGLIIMGTPDTDPVCGTQIDADCPPGLSDGTGPGLIVNANLIQANAAESGAGGGIRLQQVNGTDIATFPNGCILSNGNLSPSNKTTSTCTGGSTYAYLNWNSVLLTNNIIVNNMAGWDGAGISVEDTMNATIANNTIVSNDSLASSGVLTQSIGTPESSAPAGNGVQGTNCTVTYNGAASTASCPQSSGLTSELHSPVLSSTFFTTTNQAIPITCPPGMPNCSAFSNPVLENNVIWGNRSFFIGIGNLGNGNLNQQYLVSLYNAFTSNSAPTQTAYGQCNLTGVSYWDLGIRGDSGPSNHGSGAMLAPAYSLLDDPQDYASAHNLGVNPLVKAQYCNGTRVPPTCSVTQGCGGPSGYGVPPGIVDASAPNPQFSLTPSATVDEANNWINVSWGPLALSDDSVAGGLYGNWGGGNAFGNYALQSTSPAIDYVPVSTLPAASTEIGTLLRKDFFGNTRPDSANLNAFDIGAVEYQGAHTGAFLIVSPTTVAFGNVAVGLSPSPTQTITVSNTGTANATGVAIGTLAAATGFSRTTTCGATVNAGASCTITVTFTPTAQVAYGTNLTVTATGPAGVTVDSSPVALSGTGVAPVRTFTVTPSTLAFGNQNAGSTSAAQTITVTNTGNIQLAGGTFTFQATPAPEPFSHPTQTGACGATLAQGASCTYNVVFAPPASITASTSYSKTLTVAYTTATGTGTPVTLTGTGVPVPIFSFTSATHGTLGSVLGVETLTFTIPSPRAAVTSVVTITNTGGAALTVGTPTLSLNLGGHYSITAQTCSAAPLAAGGTCTISILYNTPTARPILPNLGAITIPNNGPGPNTTLGLLAQ